MIANAFSGLELISTATVALTPSLSILAVNPAAESLFEHSARHMIGMKLPALLPQRTELITAIEKSLETRTGYTEQELEVRVGPTRRRLVVNCTVNVIDNAELALLLEFRQIDQQLKIERDARRQAQLQSNRELIRNLAHEIKNPLGGVRGAAQLLARELQQPQLAEYTQVIIAEVDRLQNLLNRMLTPNRVPERAELNVHEVISHVLTLIDAEFNHGVEVIALTKDFDVSLPPILGDRESLTQAALNIVRNAAQILTQHNTCGAKIAVSTRIARGFTVGRVRHRLGVAITIEDNGPGIAEDLIDRIFDPLVSRREGGTGLGLTIAQTFVAQHDGTIEVESQPGATRFRLLLPLLNGKQS